MRPPILITGIARSGTSLVAGIIQGCGAKAGEVGKPGDKWNPSGYFENNTMIEKVDKMILKGTGYDPMGQEKLPYPTLTRVDIRDKVFKIAQDQGIGPNEIWYFKDAKLLLVYGSYVNSFPDSKIIIVRRNPHDIIESCLITPFMSKRHSYLEWSDWVNHQLALMDCLKIEHPQVREIWYEDLMNKEFKHLENIINWLGLEYDIDFINSIIIKKNGSK